MDARLVCGETGTGGRVGWCGVTSEDVLTKQITDPGPITARDIWLAIAEFADINHSGLLLADEKVKAMAVVFKAAQLYAEALDKVNELN